METDENRPSHAVCIGTHQHESNKATRERTIILNLERHDEEALTAVGRESPPTTRRQLISKYYESRALTPAALARQSGKFRTASMSLLLSSSPSCLLLGDSTMDLLAQYSMVFCSTEACAPDRKCRSSG